MAILVNAHEISKSFGARPLFKNLTFSIHSDERVGLVGPNGAGKSTLLKILAGQASPDEGTLTTQRGLRVGYLEQVPEFFPGATVNATVMQGAKDADDWEEISRAQEILSRLSLSDQAESPVERLSGGWKKRVALARELVRRPDLLLLDEPTNHLDVESILWLEEMLAEAPFTVLTITHDRVFLQKTSNRIIELNRRFADGLLSVAGDYTAFLEAKEQLLTGQEHSEIKLRNTLRRETEWLRQGAKARTTKQQARIQRAEELKDQVEDLSYRNQSATARLSFGATDRSPKKLIEARGISKVYGERTIVPSIDLMIAAGSRIGLLGPNGCGKSTLIRLLLEEEAPSTGSVWRSDQLQVAYFDQSRESLDPEATVLQVVCPYGDFVDFRGTRVHAKGYLGRFLFSPEQVTMTVGKLSGGEQSRLLLARLMLREANLLVLDEPTNDLDMATLDVLEEVLREFNGAILIVTHDRYFLDHVTDQILAFGTDEEGGKEIVSFSDLSQWEEWRIKKEAKQKVASTRQGGSHAETQRKSPPRKPSFKLSFKDQWDLDHMEENIQKAEARLAQLSEESGRPEIATHPTRLAEIATEMATVQQEIDRLYTRWEELENSSS